MMKNVLVLIHDDAGQEARLQAALDVTRAIKGHLSCLSVVEVPILVGDIYGISGTAQLLEGEREHEAENRLAIESRLEREDVPWNWIDVVGEIAPAINSLSDLTDIIVLNRKLEKVVTPDMQGIAASVILGSHKPVLAVPGDYRGCNFAGHAMVAWDGSAEAARVLHAAMPLLALARNVTVVEVEDGNSRTPVTEAAAYLSRHGIEPEVRVLTSEGNPVSGILLEQCRSLGADYMVLGGYGHSRVRQALFGGVTRDLLTEAPVPLLIAH